MNKTLALLVSCATLACMPYMTYAFSYTPENIHTVYQEAPSSFVVDEFGEAVGTTVSGMTFTQRNVTNSIGIRLQRFAIGSAYWYVSDLGIIWADSDLAALSVYLSRIT